MSKEAEQSRDGSHGDWVVASVGAATPKQRLLVLEAVLEALAAPAAPAVASVVASEEDSTVVVAEVASVVGLVVAAAAAASEEATVLGVTETASVHQAELHLALVVVTVETVTAASVVDTTPEEILEEIPEEEGDPMTTDPAVATAMAAVALAATWNLSDAEKVVGIATESLIVTVTVIATATAAATGTEIAVAGTMIGRVMMITGNEAMTALVTKILGNCDDTKKRSLSGGYAMAGFSSTTQMTCATSLARTNSKVMEH